MVTVQLQSRSGRPYFLSSHSSRIRFPSSGLPFPCESRFLVWGPALAGPLLAEAKAEGGPRVESGFSRTAEGPEGPPKGGPHPSKGTAAFLALAGLFFFRLLFGLSSEFFFEDETQIFLI